MGFKRQGLPVIDNCILFFMALAVALQSPLHPLSKALPGTDSAVYLYAGKLMCEGKVLYVDFFEHKGPFFYFLNWFPQKLFGGAYVGVWILEVLFLTIDAILIYLCAKMVFSYRHPEENVLTGRITAILTAGMTLYPLGFYFEGGNFTEEYALVFLLCGMYLYVKFLTGDRKEIPVKDIALIGFCCGLVALLRVNMIVLFGTYAFVLLIWFLIKKRYEDLVKCLISFAAGLLAAIVPAMIVLVIQGNMQQFLEAYIAYNTDYSVGSNSLTAILRAIYVFWGREPLLPLGLLLGLAGFFSGAVEKCETKLLLHGAGLLTLAGSLYAVGMSGRTYGHYAMILLPVFILPVEETIAFAFDKLKELKKMTIPGVIALTVVAALGFMPKNAAGFLINILGTMQKNVVYEEIASKVKAHSTEEDSVVVLGNYCSIYLASGREAGTRYFYQNPTLNVREDYREAFIEEITGNLPKVIVSPAGDLPYEDSDVERLIRDNQYQKDEGTGYTIYYR